MKNKLLLLLIYIFFFTGNSIAEEYIFEVSKIELNDKGNLIYAYDGKIISEKKDIEISAEEFNYIKNVDLLEALNGSALIKSQNIKIDFNILRIKNKNIFKATNGVEIEDLNNLLNIKGENIVLDRSENKLTATNGVEIEDLNNLLNIKSENIVLDRSENKLTATNGVEIEDLNNLLNIKSENIVLDRSKNFIDLRENIKIDDLKNLFNIQAETLFLDRSKNILNSDTETTLTDKFGNIFKSKKLEYDINKKNVKIFKAEIKDNDKNNFKLSEANIDLKSNSLNGKNIEINLNNKFLNPENEPRLKGENIFYSGNITNITNGEFTACKKTENCPPWKLSAKKITHDRNKKNISYKNVWLNIYDTPVVYFPKFFHPDPSVKRQSGFLIPTFKNSPNKNTFLSVPYYKVLNENKDFTFTPRFYAKDQLLLQNEYREVNKNSNLNTDFSILTDKGNGSESHLFFNLDKNVSTKNFDQSKFELKIEQVSNDTYLKANKINSPLINDYDVLENSLKLNLESDDLNLKTDFIVYENLNRSSSDKFEYIFPKLEITKKIENKTKLNGDFRFRSNNFVHNFNTNNLEKVNNNDLIFNSASIISKKGFFNNYEFIIKNVNTDSRKSTINKEETDFYLGGLFQFNSTYPLIKKDETYNYLLKPKLSLKLNPGHTKNLQNNDYKLNVDNLFNLDRISSEATLEGGFSVAYGADYVLTRKNNNEFLSIKLANNIRLKENKDLEKNNQLGSKTSNFFGKIKYNPTSFLTTTYNFSTLNNLTDINYQNLIADIKFSNFVNTSDYLRQDGDKNSYFLNKTTFNINSSNNLSFSTRENLKTDLTEYYNLVYQYKNDCLRASIEYQKDYYNDRDIKPEENIFLKLTIIPFGSTSSPNLRK